MEEGQVASEIGINKPIEFAVTFEGDPDLIQHTLKEYWLHDQKQKEMVLEGVLVKIILREPSTLSN